MNFDKSVQLCICFHIQDLEHFPQSSLVRLCGQFLPLSSVQFSRSVVSDSLWPRESQHARPPCPSPTPGVHSDSCPLSQWCHPAISSSVVPFSSCPQSFPGSESFPMSQLFAWGGQSTGVSAFASFLPKNTQGWSSYPYSQAITNLFSIVLLFAEYYINGTSLNVDFSVFSLSTSISIWNPYVI